MGLFISADIENDRGNYMDEFISVARGNGKSDITIYDDVLYRWTRGKKKKAFMKWLQAIGVSRENRNKFVKWIAQRKGYPPYSYNWYTFKWYAMLTSKIKHSEGGTEK